MSVVVENNEMPEDNYENTSSFQLPISQVNQNQALLYARKISLEWEKFVKEVDDAQTRLKQNVSIGESEVESDEKVKLH